MQLFNRHKSSEQLVEECVAAYEEKNYARSEKIGRRLLRRNSQNFEISLVLGNICFLRQEYEKAFKFYRQADEQKSNYYPAKINLANTCFEMRRYSDAADYARQALSLDSSVQGYIILGNSLLEMENEKDAVKAFEQALKLDSSDPWIHNYLSRAYQKNAQYSQALAAGWQAVLLSGNEKDHAINFGYLLYECAMENYGDEIKKYADLWLDKFPDDSIAKHMGNAAENNAAINKANSGYVQNIFDAFAGDFDDVLASLDYAVPELINRILCEVFGENSHPRLRILDAGCGTGLCGKYLKKYAGFFSLHGVDISPEMLKTAAGKKIYNHLFCMDLDSFFLNKKYQYDLIAAGDVFTYFGELDSLFFGMQKHLKKNGRAVFSITENSHNQKDWFLHISGRFAHHPDYIKKLAKKYGFLIEKSEYSRLRTEGGKDVFGYVFVLKKS